MGNRSTTERFPLIGRHIISEHNPAYAPTEPPQPDQPELAPARPLSFLARVYLSLRRWWR